MAKEALHISEERLGEVIRVIRAGLKAIPTARGQQTVPQPGTVRRETAAILKRWCREESMYLKRVMKKEYRP